MSECYTYKVWAKDIIPFLDADIKPVFKTRMEGKKKKMFFGYWGYYHKHYHETRMAADKVMLERSGFKRVELITLEC